MVRVTYSGHFINGKQYLELAGLSTDQKPIGGLLTGSLFHEIDTKKIYAFDEDGSEGEEWIEQVQLSEEESSSASLSSMPTLQIPSSNFGSLNNGLTPDVQEEDEPLGDIQDGETI